MAYKLFGPKNKKRVKNNPVLGRRVILKFMYLLSSRGLQ